MPPVKRPSRLAATRVISALLVITFLFFTVLPSGAHAQDEPMQHTLRSTLYGGILGGLLGTAVLFLSDNQSDHLSYIPTGVGVGMLLGATYGVVTSGVMYRSAVEVDDGVAILNLPKVDRVRIFDENTQVTDVISKVDLFKYRF
jgi:drug/metabolite transporter (DMT)-like permease